MKRLIAAALIALAPLAQADDITYAWEHATTREDGSAITGIRSYVLEVSRAGVIVATAGPTGTAHTVTGLGAGTYSARVATVESGRQGAWSPAITTTIDAQPAAPGSLRGVVVTVNVTIQ